MKTAVNPKLALLCAFALVIVAAQPAAAQALFSKDLTLHETTTGGMGGGGTTTTAIYLSANAMKRSSSDGTDTIMRFDSGKLITIDNKKKTYTEMTMEELQAMLDKASSAMQQMDPQAAEAMRKMMGGGGPITFTVTKIGPGEQIAGYATEKYDVKGGPMEMQIWAAPEVKVPATYYDAMKARLRPNPMFDMSKMYDEFKKINGMSLKTITNMKMMGREMTTTTLVNSVEKGAVPAATFEIPAGYKKVATKE
jgi:hypothetical protein